MSTLLFDYGKALPILEEFKIMRREGDFVKMNPKFKQSMEQVSILDSTISSSFELIMKSVVFYCDLDQKSEIDRELFHHLVFGISWYFYDLEAQALGTTDVIDGDMEFYKNDIVLFPILQKMKAELLKANGMNQN